MRNCPDLCSDGVIWLALLGFVAASVTYLGVSCAKGDDEGITFGISISCVFISLSGLNSLRYEFVRARPPLSAIITGLAVGIGFAGALTFIHDSWNDSSADPPSITF